MYAVVLWDWLISLRREWIFVWKTHWTPVKVAYIFCRYWVIFVVPYLLYCFVNDHPREECERIFRIPVALAMWNQVGSEVVLLIRTYAFFNRNNYLLAFLCCSVAGLIAYQLYVSISQMLLLPFVTPPFTHGPCLPMSKPHSAHLLGFFIAPLLFDTMVTFITMAKAYRIRSHSGGLISSPLIQTFIREGVFYYILISIANLVNGIFYLQPRQVIAAINIPLSVMMGPVLACRLVLDLRERGSETAHHSEDVGTPAYASKPSNRDSPYSVSQRKFKSSPNGSKHGHPTHPSNLVLTTVDRHNSGTEQDVVEMDRFSDYQAKERNADYCKDPALVELGFKGASRTSFDRGDVRGIRVDVEKTTTTTM
ncbi:hypothetical protein BDV98DRAFT_564433 [Pterulicium gracile]|uniref:DUF6533 domain-containing protein n=1 Tax=Pterulicium gracile TaxID=1884261 RepID=A0A5C3QRV8_9AGAR|nr:hypothetical protein BDV98DRAFT_564433 [Pterula gracilis]